MTVQPSGAVRAAYASGTISPVETGGSSGTRSVVDAVHQALETGDVSQEMRA
jgi:hypothetical protein